MCKEKGQIGIVGGKAFGTWLFGFVNLIPKIDVRNRVPVFASAFFYVAVLERLCRKPLETKHKKR